MRIVLQRVNKAKVNTHSQPHAAILKGFLLLLGIEQDDTPEDIKWLVAKIIGMRIFADDAQKMNLTIQQVDGEILIVSQFTLHASVKKGNRPSFIKAARPEKATPLYENFVKEMEASLGKPCKTGVFGADMQIELINDGPVTIILDSKNKE